MGLSVYSEGLNRMKLFVFVGYADRKLIFLRVFLSNTRSCCSWIRISIFNQHYEFILCWQLIRKRYIRWWREIEESLSIETPCSISYYSLSVVSIKLYVLWKSLMLFNSMQIHFERGTELHRLVKVSCGLSLTSWFNQLNRHLILPGWLFIGSSLRFCYQVRIYLFWPVHWSPLSPDDP